MSATTEKAPQAGAERRSERFKFPTAFTVLAAVLLLVWIASFFVPAGAYDINPRRPRRCPGRTTSCLVHAGAALAGAPRRRRREPRGAGNGRTASRRRSAAGDAVRRQVVHLPLQAALDSTPNGLYGVESTQGFVGPWEEGFLYGSAAIFLFVLAVGAFITVTMKTEAIQTGIGRLALRFRHSGSVLIAILMIVFALGGTSYGMWEETLGFFVLLVPLALALEYDRMVAAAIIFLGAGTG